MKKIGSTIETYTEELFAELGVASVPEEKKADIFARVEESLQQTILAEMKNRLNGEEYRELGKSLVEQNYGKVEEIISRFPENENDLEEKVEAKLRELKSRIVEEEKNAGV